VAYTRLLAELRRTDAGDFGGKSANLGDMLAAGIPVPPGFAVSADAYRTFAAASTLPAEVRDELAQRYGELGGERPPVAVRSSALGEDSEAASHAGQQESFLWVRGVDHLCDAVRDCWASLHTPRAISYRAALGQRSDAMGVTVQSMVDAEVSGVMFTCNPVSGDPSMVAINACCGLGIAVVSGEVTPDDYLVSKVTGEVVRRTVSSKHVEYLPGPGHDGTVRAEVEGARRDEPCLDDEQLAALVEVARGVERHFGSHQDIEWAIPRGERAVLVLQSRPVTRLPERAPTLTASALSLVMGTFGAEKRN